MKAKISIIIFTNLLICCNTYKRENFTYNQNEKQLWINSYKYEVFYGCIKEGLQNDSLRVILKNRDLFNPNLELDFSTIDQARQIGKEIVDNLPTPFIKIDQGDENLEGNKFISFACLNYYASKELDSIARIEYDMHKKKK
ncbi:MAG: hypothetical protein EOO50_09305 [Flavobacterium sp.]|uniref:hypothetical protein n=1 Tax=Flavobacterium sp. TaxID=239 RepID=UPI001213B496|nr:hypothetical protein [Flavobacterium sp.]RZJ66559.1 MAG: hypothetical protein EOO50_09305 [Flavobacterium sp.]